MRERENKCMYYCLCVCVLVHRTVWVCVLNLKIEKANWERHSSTRGGRQMVAKAQ
jgi:hypothetical protein